MVRTFAVVFVTAGIWASPAYAAVPMALPDPSGVTLFTLGVAGLLIGRHFAGKPRD